MERKILAVIVGSAVAARAAAIWVFRPEFVGWFNHSPYYWVQARGILENGQLPYSDLPLLFYVYAAVASVFEFFGMQTQPAIVNASRLIMSIAPALIAFPAYLIIRRINGGKRLAPGHWALVVVSAFLPLTLAHMPEILQKNALGLLLFMILMYATYALLDKRSSLRLIGVVFVFVLISLTHLGTLAVALLFTLSLSLAFVFDNSKAKQVSQILSLVFVLSITGLSFVYVLDTDAFARILRYAASSLPNSLLGGLFSAEPLTSNLLFLLSIVIPAALTYLLLRMYKKHRDSLQPADRLFWLCNIFTAYLLVLPVIDLDIVVRLILFMPLPLLVVASYHLKYLDGKRANRILVGVALLGTAVMLLGDIQNLSRLYPEKDEIHAELVDLSDRVRFTDKDFVLTKYGINPVCNWFLGTKAGLITAFNINDRTSYDRLFVLNTAERRQQSSDESASKDRYVFLTEKEKYEATRRNIPLPADLTTFGAYKHLDFYELHEIPDNWLFDADGNWIGWIEQGS